MPEGRIQFVEHLAPGAIWQRRYLDHPNGARALTGVMIAVADLPETAARWHRFAGRDVHIDADAASLQTDRGRILLVGAGAAGADLGLTPPALPWIAGPILAVEDLTATRAWLRAHDIALLRDDDYRIVAAAPAALGGFYVFEALAAGR